jgi:hypothetical protein
MTRMDDLPFMISDQTQDRSDQNQRVAWSYKACQDQQGALLIWTWRLFVYSEKIIQFKQSDMNIISNK